MDPQAAIFVPRQNNRTLYQAANPGRARQDVPTATTLQMWLLGKPHVLTIFDLPAGLEPPEFPFAVELKEGQDMHGYDIFGEIVLAPDSETARLACEDDMETFAAYTLVAQTISHIRAATSGGNQLDTFMGVPDPAAAPGQLTPWQAANLADRTQFTASGLGPIRRVPTRARAPIWGEIALRRHQGYWWVQTAPRHGYWLTEDALAVGIGPEALNVEAILGQPTISSSTSRRVEGLGPSMASLAWPRTREEEGAAAAEMEQLVDWTGGEDFHGWEEAEGEGLGGEGE